MARRDCSEHIHPLSSLLWKNFFFSWKTLRVINYQLQAECKSWKSSLVAYAEANVLYSRKEGQAENRSQVLIIRKASFQKRLNSQQSKICFLRLEPWLGKKWDPDIKNENGLMFTKISYQIPLSSLKLQKWYNLPY